LNQNELNLEAKKMAAPPEKVYQRRGSMPFIGNVKEIYSTK